MLLRTPNSLSLHYVFDFVAQVSIGLSLIKDYLFQIGDVLLIFSTSGIQFQNLQLNFGIIYVLVNGCTDPPFPLQSTLQHFDIPLRTYGIFLDIGLSCSQFVH